MTVDIRLQNAITGEIRTIVISEQLADRILNSDEPPAAGNWIVIR